MTTRFVGSGRVKEGGFLATHKQDFNTHVNGDDFLHDASHIQMNPELSDIRLKDATVQGTLEKLSSIIVGSGSAFSFVLDPLETSPIYNVFPDWNSLYTNLPDNGLIDIFVKNNIDIPSGEWDLKHRVRFVGINKDVRILLNGELINVFSFENIKIIKTHYDGSIKWTNDYGTLVLKNTSILSEEVNSVISLTDNPDDLGNASFYIINSLLGLNAVEVGEGRKLDIYAYDGSYIESNAISSISSLVSISASIDAEVHDTQDVPGGTVTISRFGVAKNLPYDNTISGLTSTDTQGAIDELSLKLGAKDAVDLSYDPTISGLSSNNAQDAIDELSSMLGAKDAVDLSYDPTISGLRATDAQSAIDELSSMLGAKDAADLLYNPINSGLVSNNAQDAIDELSLMLGAFARQIPEGAIDIAYDNGNSGLIADNTQDAIDELSLMLGAFARQIPEGAIDIAYDNGNSGLIADNTQDAIDELSLKLGAKDAVDLSYDPTDSGLSSDNVQGALDELAARQIPEYASDITYDNGNSGLVADNTQDAIDEIARQIPEYASDITYDNGNSGLVADNTQDAIDELSLSLGAKNAVDLSYDPTISGLSSDNTQDAIDELSLKLGAKDAVDLSYDPTDSGLVSNNVQDAIDELSLKLGAKDAVDLSYDPTISGLSSNNTQDAIDELSLKLGAKDAADLSYDPTDSGLSSDNAQDAIDELAARQIPEYASDITYDNGNSGLVADNTQDAIDEIVDNINNIHIPSYTLNSTDIDLSIISSPYNDLIYTIPACLVTRIYEISIILTESVVGLGNVNVRVGSTQGGDDYLIDLVTPIDETSPVGKTVSGLDIATLGSAWIGASKHVTECNENDEIHIQITTDGDITSGKLRVIIRGEIF